jgi:uncharacterized membrane protein YdjX (TVP38/TMEM64 family)
MNYAFCLTRIALAEIRDDSLVCMAPGALAYTYLGSRGSRQHHDIFVGLVLLGRRVLDVDVDLRDKRATMFGDAVNRRE